MIIILVTELKNSNYYFPLVIPGHSPSFFELALLFSAAPSGSRSTVRDALDFAGTETSNPTIIVPGLGAS
jgi:hypothetical protein